MPTKLVLTPGGYKPAEKDVPVDHSVHIREDIAEIHDRTDGSVRAVID